MKSALLEVLNEKTLKIIDFLLDNRLFSYGKTALKNALDMSEEDFNSAWKVLTEFEIVVPTDKFKNNVLVYQLNKESKIVKLIKKLDLEISQLAAQLAVKDI